MSTIRIVTFAATVLATSASFANTLPEGSYPHVDTPSDAGSRTAVAAGTAFWNTTGQPGLRKSEGWPKVVQLMVHEPPTRAEVIA